MPQPRRVPVYHWCTRVMPLVYPGYTTPRANQGLKFRWKISSTSVYKDSFQRQMCTAADGWVVYMCHWPLMGGIPNSSASRRPTNPPNGGIFHATAVANPNCASADSGKRRGETKNSSFNTPAPIPQHHRAKRTITNNNGTRRRCPLSSGRRYVGAFCVTVERHTSSGASADIGGRLVPCVVGRSVSDAHATAAATCRSLRRRRRY